MDTIIIMITWVVVIIIIVVGVIHSELKRKSVQRREQSVSHAPVDQLQYFCVKDKGYNVSVWPKDHDQFDCLEFTIAGITHYDAGSHIGECIAMLKPEPDNPYDSNAIAIFATDGKKIGYVPKDMTDEVRHYAQLPSFCYCYIGRCQGTLFSDCYISDALKVSPC